jgi:cytochrome c-type biogenesis protein CcmF
LRVWTSGLCFALSAFVCGTIAQEFWRGARVRQGATGSDLFTSMVGLVSRSHRRYGGYVVHLGIVLMFLGFAGEGYKKEEQVQLAPGQSVEVGGFTVTHKSIKVTDDGQKQMVTGHILVSEDGKALGTMYPARWFFRKHEDQPTTEVAIRRTAAEDLYLVMPAYDVNDQSMSLQVVVTPLVNWIWAGFGILVLGTGIALLPERAFAFALGRVPAGAATT